MTRPAFWRDFSLVRSMTGYGRGERVYEDMVLTVELRAVNNRFLDCSFKMPRNFLFAEDALKTRIQAEVGRGKVDAFVTVNRNGGDDQGVEVNPELVRSYLQALREIRDAAEHSGVAVKGKVSAVDLAMLPDVLTVVKKEEDPEQMRTRLLEVTDLALADFNAMREREGARLAADILGRADTIEDLVSQVEARSPQTTEEYRQRLETKMRELLGGVQVDESRLLTEAAIFADKTAVEEETVRLRSHIAQLRELFAQGGAVGRKLDFLIQEFNREANTIGSKSNDLQLTKLVVDLKAEIEKIREQVQNLE